MGNGKIDIRKLASGIMARENNLRDHNSHKNGLKAHTLRIMLIACIAASAILMVYHILDNSIIYSYIPHFIIIPLYTYFLIRLRKGCPPERVALASIVLYGFIMTPPAWLQLTLTHPMIIVVVSFVIIMTILLFEGKRQKYMLIIMTFMLTGMFIYDGVRAYAEGVDAGRHFLGRGVGMVITMTMIACCIYAFKNKYTELNIKLYKHSITDSLTGAYNARKMNELVGEYMKIYNKERLNFAISMIDMDNFKIINDTFGHDVGDKLLTEAVKTMENNLRDGDILARYGGDEFVILLPGCDSGNAKLVIERLLKAAGEISVGTDKGIISFSAGIADMDEASSDIADIFRLADKRMYHSKNNGRNMVTSAILV